jgi:hypothetical protein
MRLVAFFPCDKSSGARLDEQMDRNILSNLHFELTPDLHLGYKNASVHSKSGWLMRIMNFDQQFPYMLFFFLLELCDVILTWFLQRVT